MSYVLADAIALHRKGQQLGQQLYIFPPGINPNHFSNPDVLPLFQEPSMSVAVNECLKEGDDYLMANA
jgi:hypothetical protein